jgi:hypothetical protein
MGLLWGVLFGLVLGLFLAGSGTSKLIFYSYDAQHVFRRLLICRDRISKIGLPSFKRARAAGVIKITANADRASNYRQTHHRPPGPAEGGLDHPSSRPH